MSRPRQSAPRQPRSQAPGRRRARGRERRGRAFSPELVPTLQRVLELLGALAPRLRTWWALNPAILTVAMLQLWRGARRGNGYLPLGALSRAMPLDQSEKARWERLLLVLTVAYSLAVLRGAGPARSEGPLGGDPPPIPCALRGPGGAGAHPAARRALSRARCLPPGSLPP
jgi:hypothetical protein